MRADFVSKSGDILTIDQAQVPLSSIEYAYGFGVYENIRVVRGRSIFLEEHLQRLLHSAKTIGLPHTLTKERVRDWIDALLLKINAESCNLKLLLVGGKSTEEAVLWILPLAPLYPDKKLFRDGVAVISVRHERFLPHAKTLNMLPSYLFYRKAKESKCYDAILVDRNECITEGTRTNILAMKDRTIVSPPMKDILEGVMRSHVLAVAMKNRYEVVEGKIPLSDIASYDGFFLTSTSSKILPINAIDDTIIRIPTALRELMKIFDDYMEEVYATKNPDASSIVSSASSWPHPPCFLQSDACARSQKTNDR